MPVSIEGIDQLGRTDSDGQLNELEREPRARAEPAAITGLAVDRGDVDGPPESMVGDASRCGVEGAVCLQRRDRDAMSSDDRLQDRDDPAVDFAADEIAALACGVREREVRAAEKLADAGDTQDLEALLRRLRVARRGRGRPAREPG